jgi:hypothetical protein
VELAAVIRRRIALGEVVCLAATVVATNELPVDLEELAHLPRFAILSDRTMKSSHLVKIIGLKNGTGYNAVPRSSLDHKIDPTEKNVLSGLDSRSIGFLLNLENRTPITVRDGRASQGREYTTAVSGKVARSPLVAKGRVSRTPYNHNRQ